MAFSFSVKQRWATARQQQASYNRQTGESRGVKEFYRNQNPFTESVVKYEITYALKYEGADYEFFFPQDTFEVFMRRGVNDKTVIDRAVRDSVGGKFRGKSALWVEEHLDVKINALTKVRGIEKSGFRYGDIPQGLYNAPDGVYGQTNRTLEVIKKDSGGRIKSNNKYDLRIWL